MPEGQWQDKFDDLWIHLTIVNRKESSGLNFYRGNIPRLDALPKRLIQNSCGTIMPMDTKALH